MDNDGYGDSVSATPLAKALNAPILLTDDINTPSADLIANLKDLKAKKIVIVGGEGVVPKALADKLASSYKVERIGGNNRYETNANVAKKVLELTGEKGAFLVNGQDGYADALSVASIAATKGMPILFANKNEVPAEVKEAAKGLTISAVGGKTILPDAVVTSVGATRVAGGGDRFETNIEVLNKYKDVLNFDNMYMAYGGYDKDDFADALVASAAAAKTGAPVVLSGKKDAAEATTNAKEYLENNLKDSKVYLVGGEAALEKAIEDSVKNIVNPVATDLKVESVSAINGKEMKITFSQPVKKSTVITASGSPSVDFLNDTNVAFTSLESPAKNIAIGTTAGISAEASLSADGKTLTIMAGGNDVFEGRYQLIVQNVENTNSDKIEKYDEIVNLGKDTVAPTVKSVEKVNAATHKITFSEPVNTKGNFTYKLADGTVIPSADIVDSALSADGKSLTLTINSDKMATYSGKTIQVTLLGTTDFARNVITPNPVTFNIAVGEEDGIAPTVSSVKALSDTKIEVVFSEEVQGFNDTNAGNLTLTGTNIASGVKGFSVKQDKVDKKKYVVTLDQSALSSVDSAVADLKIVKANIVDLSGEKMKDDYTAIVTIKKDTVAPKLVSTNVVKDANGQWLELKFDKELDPTVGTAVAVNGTNATAYKNYVTETGDFAFGGTNDKLTTDKDGVKIKLADAKFKTADLVDGTKYTFDVDVKGANGVTTTTPIEISFTYNEQASSDKPEVTKNGIAVSQLDNGTITITFNKELDGSSATNTSNYTIPGVQIKSATLKPFDATAQTQDVVLRLGDNDLTGNRNITISGVRSKAGIVMDSKTDVVNLIENINPTMASAKVTGTKTIDVTFSEAITGTGISDKDDFEIKVGDTVVAYGTTANGLSADGKVVTITLDNALTATDLDKAITIKSLVGGTSAIGDTSTPANTIKSSTITVAK